MEAFGVQFRILDDQRFLELRNVYAEIKRDKDGGAFRDPAEWATLVPDAVKASFNWPMDEERQRWLSVRNTTATVVSNPDQQLGARWDFYRVFEAFEEGDYNVLGCERVAADTGELQIDPCFGYPYGGVGPLIALVEAFGFEVLGVNESGEFESRSELLGGSGAASDAALEGDSPAQLAYGATRPQASRPALLAEVGGMSAVAGAILGGVGVPWVMLRSFGFVYDGPTGLIGTAVELILGIVLGAVSGALLFTAIILSGYWITWRLMGRP